MTLVLVSIGSNIERDHHVRVCLDALEATFGELTLSSVYESEPVGFVDGRNFYNLVAGFHSDWSVGELQAWCKQVEFANGRLEGSPKFSPRTLDIDILTVGELTGEIDGVLLPREEVDRNAFVLLPLAEAFAEQRHPVRGVDYASLWQSFVEHGHAESQPLWPVEFSWRCRRISPTGVAP
ncbi:2-amino-4-hydroxy-6-hydroxymethyldihydropteridine diphosphokinase [Cobetia marina]|uniref:2-amino-4-hydroxy-6- hydroxymethyldihydropteridine diphosphokinase n=1 Tax=Cobetia marina TaxID=28258 RepID=UPI003A9435D7